MSTTSPSRARARPPTCCDRSTWSTYASTASPLDRQAVRRVETGVLLGRRVDDGVHDLRAARRVAHGQALGPARLVVRPAEHPALLVDRLRALAEHRHVRVRAARHRQRQLELATT